VGRPAREQLQISKIKRAAAALDDASGELAKLEAKTGVGGAPAAGRSDKG
jgi:hypothetical protein